MAESVKIHEDIGSGSIRVSVPYAMKDAFRKVFPSAKWESASKSWTLGKRSKAKLEQWAGVVNTTYDAEAEAQFLSAKELADLAQAIKDARVELQSETRRYEASVQALGEAHLTVLLLKSVQDEVDAVAKKLQDTATVMKATQAEIEERISRIVPVSVLKSLAYDLDRAHKVKTAQSHSRFDELQATLTKHRAAFKSAGLRLAALDYLVNANFNRHDRDGLHNMPAGAWHKITKIEG